MYLGNQKHNFFFNICKDIHLLQLRGELNATKTQCRVHGSFSVAACPSGTSFISQQQHWWRWGQGSGLLVAVREKKKKPPLSHCTPRSRWGEKKIEKIMKASHNLFASKILTLIPRPCYSVFCCIHGEQAIRKANQKCIHYGRATVSKRGWSFHLAGGFWTGTMCAPQPFDKPFGPPYCPSPSPRSQQSLSCATLLFHSKESNSWHWQCFPSVSTTALLCKSYFLSTKASE